MVGVNFKAIEKVVKKTITTLGEKKTVTIEQPSSAFYDPTKPFEGPADNPSSESPQSVIMPYIKTADGVTGNIDRADFIAYITGSAISVEPSVGWICLLDGVKYKIVEVGRTRPGITTLLWTLVLSR